MYMRAPPDVLKLDVQSRSKLLADGPSPYINKNKRYFFTTRYLPRGKYSGLLR